MFKGTVSITARSNKPTKDFLPLASRALEALGTVDIDESGVIKIRSSKFNGFLYTTSIEGRWRQTNGQYSIELDCKASPEVPAYLIVICFGICLLGLLVFVPPYLGKNEMVQKCDSALDTLRRDLLSSADEAPPIPLISVSPVPPITGLEVTYLVVTLRNGEKIGPFSEVKIRELISQGVINKTDLCWSSGMTDWQPIAIKFTI